jgi:hypothetical protein
MRDRRPCQHCRSAADALKVLVFGRANPDYFVAHYDM